MAGRQTLNMHQRKISLTTACPPNTTHASSHRSASSSSPTTSLQWLERLWSNQLVRWCILAYAACCMLFATSRFLSSEQIQALPPVVDTSVNLHHDTLAQNNGAPEKSLHINDLTTRLRLGKMFSKSAQHTDNIHPFWLKAAGPVTPVSITTVLTMDDLEDLKRMADQWKGSISATLQIENNDGLEAGQTMQALMQIQHEFEANPTLRAHVDLHVMVQPHGTKRSRLQVGRNVARLFSRSPYVMHTPIRVLWLAPLTMDDTKRDLLDQGQVLVVPTFAFPPHRYSTEQPSFPTTREQVIEWVDADRIGLMDYHWELNGGPTNYDQWEVASEPYMVVDYDYHYGPIYITTKEDHPWCEERFEDQLPACVYATYLNGADFWVLPDTFVIRSGQEPENHLPYAERVIQDGMYKNYRIEQCAFYARQFDQLQVYNTERGTHVKQECAKALKNEKIIQ